MSGAFKKTITFGTDGWRGIIAQEFTFENVRKVSQAIADYINLQQHLKTRKKKVVVGYDTRFLSDKFALHLSEVLAGNGIEVILSDRPIPTPCVSLTTKTKRLSGGIMVTASHNPAQYNGIKFKTPRGLPADESVTEKIEKLISNRNPRRMGFDKAKEMGLIRPFNPIPVYVKKLRTLLDLSCLKGAKCHILLDLMYGSGIGVAERVFEATGIRVSTLHRERNPSFPNLDRPEPIEENLEELKLLMNKGSFDLGLALDGDADRIGCILPKGRFINAHKIISLLILHLIEDRRLKGAVAKTIAGGMLIDRIASRLGLQVYETPVGFKHISTVMQNQDVLIGGEEAGGIGFKGYIPERDGILAAALLVEMMAFRRKPLAEITDDMERSFGRFYYGRRDLSLAEPRPCVQGRGEGPRRRARISDYKENRPKRILGKRVEAIKDYDGIKFICEDESWCLLRPSGTEPVFRIYAEAPTKQRLNGLLDWGRHRIMNG